MRIRLDSGAVTVLHRHDPGAASEVDRGQLGHVYSLTLSTRPGLCAGLPAGGLAERLNAAVLKTVIGLRPIGGSNPSPSAITRWFRNPWRGGRAAEGAPLLREYRGKTSIEGSNPSLSANQSPRRAGTKHAPVAQLDRASDYGSEGQEFESLRAHHRRSGSGT